MQPFLIVRTYSDAVYKLQTTCANAIVLPPDEAQDVTIGSRLLVTNETRDAILTVVNRITQSRLEYFTPQDVDALGYASRRGVVHYLENYWFANPPAVIWNIIGVQHVSE